MIAGISAKRVMATAAVSFACLAGGCSVMAVTDAAVSVAATTVKVTANVVGGVTDLARAGVRAVTSNDSQRK
jgi:hypothetical protein